MCISSYLPSIFHWGIQPQKLHVEKQVEVAQDQKLEELSLDQLKIELKNLYSSFTTVEEHLIQCFPDLKIEKFLRQNEWISSNSSYLFRFFATLFNTFATTFNFYDESDTPPSIYEKQVLIQIYYRFFQIPYTLALVLQPLVLVAWKTYLIVMTILAAAAITIYAYLKWLQPFPDMKILCEDIDSLIAKEFPRGLIQGLDVETNALIQSLNRSGSSKMHPVMLIGETGNGKTTLFYKLHQMIKEGKVPESLKNKKVVLIYGGKLMANHAASSFADKIKYIEKKLSGQRDVIICIDEIDSVALQPECFRRMKEFMRRPDFQFIGATSKKLFQSICKADTDYSFRRPLNYIVFEKWETIEVQALLNEMVIKGASDTNFTKEALEKIIELSDKELTEASQPAKALHLFESVVGSWKTNFGIKEPSELKEKRATLRNMQLEKFGKFPLNLANSKENILAEEVKVLEANHLADLKKGQQIHEWLKEKEKWKQQMLKEGAELLIAYQAKQSLNEDLQKNYLRSFLHILKLDQQIQSSASELSKKGINIKIDAQFVETVFKKRKQIEETIPH